MLRKAFLVSAFLLSGSVARADVMMTYSVAATVHYPTAMGSVWGTVVLDETNGQFVSSDLSGSYPGGHQSSGDYPGGNYVISVPVNPAMTMGNVTMTIFGPPQSDTFGVLYLALPWESLVGFTGGAMCSEDAPCQGVPLGWQTSATDPGVGIGAYSVKTGTLTQVSPAPEPSSIALLGTGLLGVLGASRKRSGRRALRGGMQTRVGSAA